MTATITYVRWIPGNADTSRCPGRALAAGDATPASPRGNLITLSMKADGLSTATGKTTGTTRARTATM